MPRVVEKMLKTPETEISVKINLDGEGKAEIKTEINFLNHMLKALAKYGEFDLKVSAKGDLKHHIIEDTAICLGQSIKEALGDRKRIRRFGYAIVPMDDSLIIASVDLAKRLYSKVKLNLKEAKVEDADTADILHFFRSFTSAMEATIHIVSIYGENDHHKIEAAFKSLALALKQAIKEEESYT